MHGDGSRELFRTCNEGLQDDITRSLHIQAFITRLFTSFTDDRVAVVGNKKPKLC